MARPEEGEKMASTRATTDKAELERLVKLTIEKVEGGAISLDDVLAAIAPTPKIEDDASDRLPIPREITEEEKQALVKVTEVYGKVVPTERRKLTSDEVSALVEEKETLDTLRKMAEKRMDDGIKVAIHNHLDIEAEEKGIAKGASRNADGHYILNGEVRGNPDTPKRFTRETRTSKPRINAVKLKEILDHETWLSITTQVRMLDESKLMIALRKNPELIVKLQDAIEPGSTVVSLNLRKA